jgi:hypothetical protein
VAAYADLQGLGPRQGPPTSYAWVIPNVAPALLPWLAMLGLLALPSNRQRAAWWILVPLGTLALIGAGLQTVGEATDNDILTYLVPVGEAIVFGLASLWVAGAALARLHRALDFILGALLLAAVGLLTLCSGAAWEQVSELIDSGWTVLGWIAMFAGVIALVFRGTLHLVGWRCRRRFSRWRCILWLPPALWVTCVTGTATVMLLLHLISSDTFEWGLLLVPPLVAALVCLGLMLPFLLLSFICPFYLERLKRLLRVPVPPAPPAAEQPPLTVSASSAAQLN